MKKSILLCGIIINLTATQCMPMAAVRSFLSRHIPMVLHAVKKAPTVFAHAARNHKVLTTSLALVSTAIAIPQTRRAMSRGINSVLNSCLFNAAQQGYAQMVKILLKTGIDINQQDLGGWTALHWAARNGYQVVVELLLAHGADPNLADNSGWTALHRAALHGHQAVVESLLAHGADIDLTDNDGATALHRAARNGYQAVVELLLAHGADPNIADNLGWPALHWAAYNGHQAVFESLLAHGADLNIVDNSNSGMTALHRAAAWGNQAVVELLLAYGANPNIADNNGVTALHYAALRGHQAVVGLLVSYGADIALRTTDGRTAEDFASGEEIRSYLHSVPQLTADIKSAVEQRDVSAVQQLVSQKAPFLIPDQAGNTLLHYAIKECNQSEPSIHDEVACILISKAPRRVACVRNRRGQTPLHVAVDCGNSRMARYILKRIGAEGINLQDDQGNTPLHYARTRIMRDLLLENHADPTLMNCEGRVPMALCPHLWYDLIDQYGQQ